jgi:hypothetical protein
MRVHVLVVGVLMCGLVLGCEKKEEEERAPAPAPVEEPSGAPAEEAPAATGEDVGEQARDAVEEAKRQGEEAAREAQEQVAEVSAEARKLMADYLGSLEELTGSLSGLEGGLGDLGAAPRVKELVDQVKGYVTELTGLDPAVLTSLKERFGPQLETATRAVRAQIDRVGEIPRLKPVADVLRGLELVE